MRHLYLHVGHGRTGSGTLQACLAESVEPLAEAGFAYPVQSTFARVGDGAGSSGNGLLLKDMIEVGRCDIEGNVLLSSVHFFHGLTEPRRCASFAAFLKDNFAGAKILLFIRDPVAHACAKYVHMVKSQDEAGTVSEYFERYDNLPALVCTFLDNVKAIPKVDVTVRNYSANPDTVAVTAQWLGMDKDRLNRPPARRGSRPPTRSELELQRLLNAKFGSVYPAMYRTLVRELPELEGGTVYPDLANQKALWERLSAPIAQVNAQVQPSERYDIERDLRQPVTDDADRYRFSGEQLGVIADVIRREAEQARKLKKENARLKSHVTDQRRHLRDQQLRIDALENSRVMRWARRLRRMVPRLR